MADFKLNMAYKGKTIQKEVKEADADIFVGKKISAKVSGDQCGFEGYEFEITGGSDHCGFPMRKDVDGIGRKRILAVSGVGLKKKVKITKKGERKIKRKFSGIRQRKTVAGNTIHANIAQINVKVLKMGKNNVFEAKEEAPKEGGEAKKEAPKKEAPAKEEKKEEKKAEETKEAPKEKAKEEPKPEEKKEEIKEAPKEEKKEEPKESPKEESK